MLKVQTKELQTTYRNRHKNTDCLPLVKRSHHLCTNLAEFSGKMWKTNLKDGARGFQYLNICMRVPNKEMVLGSIHIRCWLVSGVRAQKVLESVCWCAGLGSEPGSLEDPLQCPLLQANRLYQHWHSWMLFSCPPRIDWGLLEGKKP